MPTREEEIIRRYFEAFNNHDLEGVIACFHPEPVVVDSEGQRVSLRVGEVAARAGVHRETLRYYERRGLIPAPPRRNSGYPQLVRGRCRVAQFEGRAGRQEVPRRNAGFEILRRGYPVESGAR